MKNLIYIKLFALLLALLAGINVAAAYDFEEGGIYYNLNEDGASVAVTFETTNYNSYSGDVVIPNFVNHGGTTYTVTAIGDYAFRNSSDLASIVISDSVNTVGRAVFWGCTELKNVTIGKSVTSLRGKKGSTIYPVFKGCDNITSLTWNAVNCTDNGNMGTTNFEQITIGDEVQVIPSNFAFQSQITELVIPNSVTTIGTWAFSSCRFLENVTLGNSVTSIGSSAFYDCKLLESIDIPDAVTSISGSAFAYCTSLSHVTLGNSVNSIGSSAFANCYNLERIVIPNSVSSIGSNAFAECKSMTEITLGNSVTNIGGTAFNNCEGIEEINIPNSVTQIGLAAFEGCKNLSKVNISSLESWCGIVFEIATGNNGVTNLTGSTNPLFYAHHLYLNDQEVTDLVIPESVNAINNYAFIGGSELTNVTIGDNVITIGDYAFYGCTGLTHLTLGDSITSIGSYAFENCTGLTSVTLGKSISTISCGAFYGCTGLTSLTIGKSVTSLNTMIENCPSLTSLSVESGNPVYDSRDNCNAIIETATNTLVVGCQTSIIPNTITSIGDYAFRNCKGLISMTIPNSVTSIGCWSFSGCKDLTTVYIPNSVTSIGVETIVYVSHNDTTYSYNYYNPFEYCRSLRTMIVENGNPMFDSRGNCNAVIETATNTLKFGCLATVIPNTVTAIGDNAFSGSGLTSIDIPNSVTSIGNFAFWFCDALTDIDIPNSVTTIGYDAFGTCLALTNITIPNSVIAAERHSATEWFVHCWSLERVTIGSGIAYMGVLFIDCPSITSVTCLGTIPPVYDSYYNSQTHEYVYNFDNAVYEQATLYVPIGSLEVYQSQREWSFFQDIRPLGDADGDGLLTIGDVTNLIDYLLSGSGNGLDRGAADVDGDGVVGIADVTELIDTLLNQ